MLKMQIVSKVVIEPIGEDLIKELLIAEIQRQDPTVVVNNIDFTMKRSPAGLEATVDAQLTGQPTPTFVSDKPETISEGDSDKQEEIPLDEPTEAKEEVATTTVADILSQTSA